MTKGEDNLGGVHFVLAGALTGTLTRFIVQPLDVLKISFQLQITPLQEKKKPKYTSVLQAIHTIVREEGVGALWKGHIPAQCLSIIFGAVQFSSYEMLTKYFYKKNPLYFSSKEHIINIGCGAFAGLTATILSFPFDVVKTHLVYQSKPPIYTGSLDVVSKIYQKERLRGFSKGLLAACIQTTPASGLLFFFQGIFSQVWLWLSGSINSEHFDLSVAGSITTGLGAGLCAKTIVYPYDLMKKRLQIQAIHAVPYTDKKILRCNNIRECFSRTVKLEGFLGLFKGFAPTVIKSGATTALYFTFYNKTLQVFKKIKEKKSRGQKDN